MSELPIQRLGPYLIDRIVGQGAMGLVFAALHDESREMAAIKVLAPAIAADEKFRERFEAEIESLKTLNHPNIVSLLGYGEHEGHLYYAMELIEGTNLEQELSAGRRFNWRDVTQIGIDISRALKHAHDHGVIHRDLKPANLLVDANEQVKLTDFGIAKLFGASGMTLNGNVLGTVDYMAPEQASGEVTSPRCDLYSLGCVMYALLTGGPPFRGKSIPEVLHKVRYEQHRPLRQSASDVPVDLERIIDELLEKDPDARIRTALSLSHRLRSIQQALSISTTDKSDFSSDDETSNPNASATNLIVNPPPDITERPTVFLTEQQEASNAIAKKQTERRKKKEKRAKKSDHFTRIESATKQTDFSRNEFSSAIPLLLMLLTVLGTLMGGVWYNTRPLAADDLYARILDTSSEPGSLNLGRDVERFLSRFPEDNRIDRVKEVKKEVEIFKLQKQFEIKAKARPETGSLAPIEVHCYEAFRAHRDGDLERAIAILKGVRLMFGSDQRSDIRIQRAMELVSQLLPKWEEELTQQVRGLRPNAELHLERAREIVDDEPERAREIWVGIVRLYKNRPWAEEIYAEAQAELSKREWNTAAELMYETPTTNEQKRDSPIHSSDDGLNREKDSESKDMQSEDYDAIETE